MAEIPTKPYLVRAIHAWCEDSGYRPYIAVVVDERTQVPREFVRNGEIVLNVSAQATNRLRIGNELIEFEARFSGAVRAVSIPIENVSAIYAQETGHGMAFDVVRGHASRPPVQAPVTVPTAPAATAAASPELSLAPEPSAQAEPPAPAPRRTGARPKLVPKPAAGEGSPALAVVPTPQAEPHTSEPQRTESPRSSPSRSEPVASESPKPESSIEATAQTPPTTTPDTAVRKSTRGGRRRAATPASVDRASAEDQVSVQPASPEQRASEPIASPDTPLSPKTEADPLPEGGSTDAPPETPPPGPPTGPVPGRPGRGHLKRVK
jgi:stringent starvation protein B